MYRRSCRLVAANAAAITQATPTAPVPVPATKKRATRAATKPKATTKKRKTGLQQSVNTTKSLGVVDPESDINGFIFDMDGEPCDVMLVLVDPAKHMDKFFVLQLIEHVDGSYVVYTRWGRTGTSGQALVQPFDEEDEDAAVKGFLKKFKEKTGRQWEDRSKPTVGKKYRFIQQNFGEKQLGYGSAKWQYWVDDNVDGKINAWYDYSVEGAMDVERLFQESSYNPMLTNRLVDSGAWTYDVNLTSMIQTNVKHPNKTSRRIRRCPVGEEMDDAAPLPVVSFSLASTIPTPATPIKSSSAALVTPTTSPVKPAPVPSAVRSLTDMPSPVSSSNGSEKSPPVDVDIGIFYSATPSTSFNVVKDANDEWYDVVLNQCNITGGSNNNKYYRIQLLQNKSTNKFHVWFKWGRVGETPASNSKDLKGAFATEEAALKVFAKKYQDKTGNKWGAATFVPKNKKYTLIQIDNDVEVKEEDKVVNVKQEVVEYLPSQLDPKTKELIEVLFSKDMRDSALTSFNLDLKRLPLGVPSQQQIQVGVSILSEIEDKLNGGDVSSDFHQLSSRFYTSIPHSFGRRRPPVINSNASLQERYDMCNILLDMFSTNETMRKIEEEKVKMDIKQVPYPADLHYKSLHADLSLVGKSSQEYKKIQKDFDKTKSSGSNATLFDVWQVDRQGERERFENFADLKNRRLLWHGTNIAVVAPIVTSGLRIMPHSGGRVGSGIYLAAMQEKSSQYTSGYGSKFACMFLCESALGKVHKITEDGHHASSLKKAPKGFDSVHAVGTITPKTWKNMDLDGKNVKVAQDTAVDSGVQSSFHHDEFLVYNEEQVRLRYILTVKLY